MTATTAETAEVLAALQTIKDRTPLPDPTRVAKLGLEGTYVGPEPPDLVGTVVLCKYVPAERIHREQRAFAKEHADRAADMLGTARVEIDWFEVVDADADFPLVTTAPDTVPGGICFSEKPGRIALNAGLRPDRALMAVIAHEVRHSQQQAILALLADPKYREQDADWFAEGYAATVE